MGQADEGRGQLAGPKARVSKGSGEGGNRADYDAYHIVRAVATNHAGIPKEDHMR